VCSLRRRFGGFHIFPLFAVFVLALDYLKCPLLEPLLDDSLYPMVVRRFAEVQPERAGDGVANPVV
jgi:hypothetical protein